MLKPKALIFFQYLPPWRIDVFNEMAKFYDLTIAFTDADLDGFKYNREELLNKLDRNIKTIFLSKGFRVGKRPIRTGVFKIIKVLKPKVIFSHEYSATSIMVAKFKKKYKYQLVITTSDNLSIAKSVSGLKSYFRNYVLHRSNSVVVYSNRVKKWYEENFPYLNVEVCPNIQNPQSLLKYRCEFPELIKMYKEQFNLFNKKLILYSGRLEHIKGLDLLLSSFSKSRNSDCILVLVGEGSKKDDLVTQTISLGIKDKVIFPGFYSGVKLYAWYEMAQFYVLPSRFEPFGAVINEALIFGTPVMASKYIGAIDFVTDQNGKLFDPLSEMEFVNVLDYFIENSGNFRNDNNSNLMPVSFQDYVEVFKKFAK